MCKMLRRGWWVFWPYLLWYLSDAVAFGARTGICREMRAARALHYLADGRERVRETERARELRHSLQTPGNIISSMPRAEPIRVPRRAPQTAIISSRNRNAFDTPAPITSERLAGAQGFFVFFAPSCAKGAFVQQQQQQQQEPNAKLFGEEAWWNQRVGQNICSPLACARQLQLI